MRTGTAYRTSKHRFTGEQYQKAVNVDLVAFFNHLGFDFRRKGSGKYYQSNIHDSFIVKYDTDKPSWHWNSRGMHGSSAVSFLTQHENMDLDDAVITLAGGGYAAFSMPEVQVKEKPPFVLPEVNPTNNTVYKYLTGKRRIDAEIVSAMLEQGRIYESAPYHNCVFLGLSPEGEVVFATERGTYDQCGHDGYGKRSYRHEVEGSAGEYRFVMDGRSDIVYICEAPIDCMSHASLYKRQGLDWQQDTRLALCGNCDLALDGYLRHHPDIRCLIWAVDNDQGGQTAIDRYYQKYADRGYESYRQKHGFFACPDEIFNESLSPVARVVYIYLCWCADEGRSVPSYRDIAYMCDIGIDAAHKAVRELIAANKVIRVPRYDTEGRQITNLYILSGFPPFNTFLEDECGRLLERMRKLYRLIEQQGA